MLKKSLGFVLLLVFVFSSLALAVMPAGKTGGMPSSKLVKPETSKAPPFEPASFVKQGNAVALTNDRDGKIWLTASGDDSPPSEYAEATFKGAPTYAPGKAGTTTTGRLRAGVLFDLRPDLYVDESREGLPCFVSVVLSIVDGRGIALPLEDPSLSPGETPPPGYTSPERIHAYPTDTRYRGENKWFYVTTKDLPPEGTYYAKAGFTARAASNGEVASIKWAPIKAITLGQEQRTMRY